MKTLGKKIVTGAAWMVGMRVAVSVLGLLSIAILARLLTPNDFGLVALAGSAYYFLVTIGQFGFDWALIHHENPSDDHYSSAWTANILVGALVATILLIVAKPAAAFFNDPRIENIVYAFSIISLAKGFENIGVVNFRKYLQFKGDFLYFVVPKLASVVAGVAAAYTLRTYWALVIGMFASQLAFLIYSHVSQPFRPRFTLSRISELFDFSKWIVANNGLRFLISTVPEVVLGRVKGAGDVGIFRLAQKIAYLPTTEIMAPINRALFPGFSTVSSDSAALCRMLIKVVGITALLSIPSAFLLLALAEPIVLVVFGSKWTAVAPVLGVLGFVGVLDAVGGLFEAVLLARGRPSVLTVERGVASVIALILSLTWVSEYGVVGIAMALTIAFGISKPGMVIAAALEIQMPLRHIWASIWRPLSASVLMYWAISTLQDIATIQAYLPILQFVVLALVAAILFLSCTFLLWRLCGSPQGAETTIVEEIKKRLERRKNEPQT